MRLQLGEYVPEGQIEIGCTNIWAVRGKGTKAKENAKGGAGGATRQGEHDNLTICDNC